MKEKILFFFLVFFTMKSFGQTVHLSNTNINQGGFDFALVIGQLEGNTIVLQSNIPIGTDKERVGLKSRKLQVVGFNENLQKKWLIPVSNEIQGNSMEGASLFNNQLYLIYYTYSKEKGTIEVYYNSYNSSGQSIASNKQIATVPVAKLNNLEKIRVLISPDKNNLGIYINEADENQQQIHLTLLSKEGNVKQSDFKINYGNSLLYLSNLLLDNQNDLYLTGELKNRENKKQKSQYLFCYSSSLNTVIEKAVTDFNSPISELKIKFNPLKNEIVCGGIGVDNTSYSGSRIKLLYIDSVYSFKEVNYSIQGASLKELIGERNSSGISLDNYTIQDLILREDGGALLVTEAQYMSEYSFYDQFTQTFNRRTEYHFDNIVLFSVSPEEKIDWCRVIKKDQVSMDDFGILSSFASYANNEEIGILYNKDSGRNFEMMHVLINKNGEMTSKRINKSNIDAIIPRYNKQLGATSTCLPVLIKRQLYLAKIEFE